MAKGNHEIKVADIFNGTTVQDTPKEPVTSDKSGANAPKGNITGKTYITWEFNEETNEYEEIETQNQPKDWYDYDNGKWANIKTTNNGLEAYWVWIPRYEYIEPTSTTVTEIEVKFIPTSQKQADAGYTIHPAFTNEGNGGFGDLDGIWVAKYEAVNNNSKVEVVSNKASWRNITTNNIFATCRRMTNEGEVLAGSTVDSHMMKNTEWGAVAILSQSKYGIYNLESSTGENGDKTYQVWNNPSNSQITGSVGNTKDAINQLSVNVYNSANGPKASTTGTVYGVYDMAGGNWEVVAGCLNGQENAKFGVTIGDTKYVDLYTNSSNSSFNYDGAKIGDVTKKRKDGMATPVTLWNRLTQYSYVVGYYASGTVAGVFAFSRSKGSDGGFVSFRVVLVPLR